MWVSIYLSIYIYITSSIANHHKLIFEKANSQFLILQLKSPLFHYFIISKVS